MSGADAGGVPGTGTGTGTGAGAADDRAAAPGTPGAGGPADPGAGGPGAGGGVPGADAPRDPSAQPERTRLSWRRTTLGCAVVVALAWRHALFVRQGPLSLLLASVTTLLWLVMVAVAQQRIQRLASAVPPELGAPAMLTVTACSLAMTGCGALLIL